MICDTIKKWPYPSSIKFICYVNEFFGVVDPIPDVGHKVSTRRRVFNYVSYYLLLIFKCLHLLNTLGRSIRYLSEFYEALAEDLVLLFGFIGIWFFHCHKLQFESLKKTMETSFSKADVKLNKLCDRKAFYVFIFMRVSSSLVAAFKLLEKWFPLTEDELQKQEMIYHTKHPNRRLIMNLWIPFVDLTDSVIYPVAFVLHVYPILFLGTIFGSYLSILPMILTHIEGQYIILTTYMKKIGRKHKDMLENPVFYTDIESDRYVFAPKPIVNLQVDKRTQILIKRQEMKDKLRYERLYIRQLVKFHQKIYNFQMEVSIDMQLLPRY